MLLYWLQQCYLCFSIYVLINLINQPLWGGGDLFTYTEIILICLYPDKV